MVSLLVGFLFYESGIYTWRMTKKVQRIKAKEATQIIAHQTPTILDARTEEEFALSHIEGALRFEESLLDSLPKNHPVLVYCTIGVRSNRVARQLRNAGFSLVYDMKDGILGWANSELPVVNSAGLPSDSIHTYNKSFSLLLRKGKAVY